MSDAAEKTQQQQQQQQSQQNSQKSSQESEKSNENENEINSCAGGLSDQQVKDLQDELDRAKEEQSYSTRSKCCIA